MSCGSTGASLPGFPAGACPGEAARSRGYDGAGSGAPAAEEAGLHLPSLRCRAGCRPSRCGRAATLRVAERGRAELQRCLPEMGRPELAGAQETAGGHGGPSARHLRGLQQYRDPPVAAGGVSRGCAGRELEAVGDGRSAGRPAAAFQPSATCFHSFPAPVPLPSVPGSGRGASPAPLSGRPGSAVLPFSGKNVCDASSPLPSHFVVLFIFLNKLLVIYGLSLAFFSSLPPATC